MPANTTANQQQPGWDEGLELDTERPMCEKHGPLAAGYSGYYCEDCVHEMAVRYPDQRHLNNMPHKTLMAHYRTLIMRQAQSEVGGVDDLSHETYEIAIVQVEDALLSRMIL